MDDDPTLNEEALIDALIQLPAQRIGAISKEAIGRRSLDLELAIIEMEGLDPGSDQPQ